MGSGLQKHHATFGGTFEQESPGQGVSTATILEGMDSPVSFTAMTR